MLVHIVAASHACLCVLVYKRAVYQHRDLSCLVGFNDWKFIWLTWQGVNSWLMFRLTLAARVSVSLSLLAVLNTLYKYIYYTLYRKVRLSL